MVCVFFVYAVRKQYKQHQKRSEIQLKASLSKTVFAALGNKISLIYVSGRSFFGKTLIYKKKTHL